MSIHSAGRRAAAATTVLALAAGIASGVGGGPKQESKLTASDAADGDTFGYAVAASGDTAVVGAVDDNSNQGSAYVFTRNGTDWTEQAHLTASDAANNDFLGSAVALSGDTAVLAAHGQTTGTGAAYVFTRTGTAWSQQQKLTADDAAVADRFGESVAVSGDTAVVGADLKTSHRGAAYVFTRSGTTWTQQTRLVPSETADGDFFGGAVAIDGDTALVSASGYNASRGAVFVFTRSGTTWTQQAKLSVANAVTADSLGVALALSGDTAAVGSVGALTHGGATFVFTRTGTTWTQQAKLYAPGVNDRDNFGLSVALSGDTLLAGAARLGEDRGAAFVFTRAGTAWTNTAKLQAVDAADGDFFGGALALSGDAVLAGAYGKSSQRGAAYVFDLTPPGPPSSGHVLATKVKAKANAAHPEKSTLTASGTLDTGVGAPTFSGAATFDAGGFHVAIPAFVPKGKSLTYSAGGIALKITPSKSGSSHATFSVKATGDLAGKVALSGPLTFRFANPAHDVGGTANLAAGALAPHGVSAPTHGVLAAAAVIKGPGKDALKLTLTFSTDGVVPAAAEDLTICFGDSYTSPVLFGTSFVKKGSTWTRKQKAPGFTKTTVDYAKGRITLAASGLDLGEFAAGGNAVLVTVIRGNDERAARVRMALAGTKLSY